MHLNENDWRTTCIQVENIYTVPGQNVNLRRKIRASYLARKELGHIFWGATKPTIILTDNKSVTRFLQTKMMPPPLWNACNFVLQFNFVIAHVPDKMNTAADFLSGLEADPKEKKHPKNTGRQNCQCHWSQHRINGHRTRRNSFKHWWRPDWNP